jgi:hypothetical protein
VRCFLQLSAVLLVACSNGTTWLGNQIAADVAGSGAAGGSGDSGSSAVPGDFFARYEAESTLNTLTDPAEALTSDSTCPPMGVEEGADCASAGQYVSEILGKYPCQSPPSATSNDSCQPLGGGIAYNQVTVPSDGVYDVTWWYHCGESAAMPAQADVFGDKNCGGLDYQTGVGSGCRPQLIDVNGVAMSSTIAGQTALYYQFPCYPVPWSVLHGATTQLPLKAGANTIYIHAPGATGLDASDQDALDVQAAGHGVAPPPLWPKLVTPVVSPD